MHGALIEAGNTALRHIYYHMSTDKDVFRNIDESKYYIMK
jgi:hypothetical protein